MATLISPAKQSQASPIFHSLDPVRAGITLRFGAGKCEGASDESREVGLIGLERANPYLPGKLASSPIEDHEQQKITRSGDALNPNNSDVVRTLFSAIGSDG